MGVNGLWPILSRTAKRHSLPELVVNEGFRPNEGPPENPLKIFKLGVDASTWMHAVCPVFRYNHAGAGQNPELRTLFHRLAAILAMPVHAIFVFDGPARPHMKRGKQVRGRSHWLTHGFQDLIKAFGFQWHQAPAEAEAELATLSRLGFVDIVLTTDVDSLVFGATRVARCPERPGRFENIEIYEDEAICNYWLGGLPVPERVLIALLVGGDCNAGLAGCGITIAHSLAPYGLGSELSDAFWTVQPRSALAEDLVHWRNKLRNILTFDPDGHLGRRYPKVASMIPESFPDYEDMEYYFSPLTSFNVDFDGSMPPAYEASARQPCIASIASLCVQYFGFGWEAVLVKMRATIWEGAAVRRICELPKQPGDLTTYRQTGRGVHDFLSVESIDTPASGSKLVVFRLRYDARQFADAAVSALHPSPSDIAQSTLGKRANDKRIYMKVPAAVVDHALPDVVWKSVFRDWRRLH